MSHRHHHGPLVAQHTERVFPEPALWAVYTLAAVLILIALAGCAGGGPLGTGLGEVVGNIAVSDGKGTTCTVALTNGKDQTNLEIDDLHVCGASIGKLHADRSDGATAAINANAAVANHAIDVGAGLAGAALTAAGIPHGSPKPAPPPVVVPPPIKPFPGAGDGGDNGGNSLAPRPRAALSMLESQEP